MYIEIHEFTSLSCSDEDLHFCSSIIHSNTKPANHHPTAIELTIFFSFLLGGLFSEGEEEQELMFRLAVERINSDPTILPRSTLVAQVEKIGREDSFHANKKGTFNKAALLFKKILLFRSFGGTNGTENGTCYDVSTRPDNIGQHLSATLVVPNIQPM